MKRIFQVIPFLTLAWSLNAQMSDVSEMLEQPTDEFTGYTEEEMLRSWGWLLAERFNLKDLELTEQEMDWIAAGMVSHVKGEEPATNLRESQYSLQEYFAKREIDIRSRQLSQNRRKEQEFFDSLMGDPDLRSLATGLYYKVLRPGSEVKPGKSDSVLVRYEGRFLDNTVFDSTEGGEPVKFKLGEVIDGWTQGIQLIGEGGKIKLFVPSKLGYGEEGRPGIPPASVLVFEVELLKVLSPEEAADDEGVDIIAPVSGASN